MTQVLQLTPRITLVPVIHASGDFAVEVRRLMLSGHYDCVAVPLPPSFQSDVEAAITSLPTPTLVVQRSTPSYDHSWQSDDDDDNDDELAGAPCSYVPIDPCQPVIAALRIAIGEHIHRAFIDLETSPFIPLAAVLPDPYALKQVSLERFATAMLPAIGPPPIPQARQRIRRMACRLRELDRRFTSVLCLCSMLDWPWLRDAFQTADDADDDLEDDPIETPRIYVPRRETLVFLLGELPFITSLYERARRDLDRDDNLSVDGVKELLLVARAAYRQEFGSRGRPITPHLLSTCLKYVRNLALLDRRMTPDLYTLVMATKQVAGDSFAMHVAEQARAYELFQAVDYPEVTMGIDRMRMLNGDILGAVNRLPGLPVEWRGLQLQPRPRHTERRKWQMRWNPFSQCSWPPEDKKIEDFRTHVADKAKAIMGADLAKTEKFTTSIKDGIDIRDTLRNWHTGELYVKVMPPVKGRLDAVVMLFDSPADPREYPWRTTWFAEHQNESTLAFFASDFHEEMVGPGIGLATYGGAMFLFPPVAIPDVWSDPRLDFTSTLEERTLAAACLHSECPHVALMSSAPAGAGWRRLAKRYKKKWVHVPLNGFSQATIQQLRMVHVLNGHHVRSFAADFIRKA